MKISFQGRTTRETFIRANLMHCGLDRPSMFVIPLAFAMGISIAFRDATYALTVGILVVAFVAPIVFILAFRMLFSRAYERHPHQDRYCCYLDDQRAVAESENGNLELRWENITKMRAADGIILLYTAPSAFHTVSRDEFESEAEWKRAEAFVKEHVTSKRR